MPADRQGMTIDNLGTVISAQAKDRIERYISDAEKQGAKILVDGRGAKVKGQGTGSSCSIVIDFVKHHRKTN
jgi:malonate-semialdehyde dehydrogenase (acetylating)/methylmalonate-semialdehyde dehydrogenase